jgi:hypothetical protein
MTGERTNRRSIRLAAPATLPAMTPVARARQRRRVLLVVATLLATIEVGGAVVASVALARSTPVDQAVKSAAPAVDVGGIGQGRGPSPWQHLAAELPLPEETWRTLPVRLADAVLDRPAAAMPALAPTPSPTPATAGSATTAATGAPAGASRTAAVVTHRLRIPSLGIDRTTRLFPCDRAEPPGNYVYRWGCAKQNNLYLLGHAATVFKKLHDAYADGRLRVGMAASYTDAKGVTRLYRVREWRVVAPTEVDWAISSQPVPSMTLQTCFGPDNAQRLLVRLVAA